MLDVQKSKKIYMLEKIVNITEDIFTVTPYV